MAAELGARVEAEAEAAGGEGGAPEVLSLKRDNLVLTLEDL